MKINLFFWLHLVRFFECGLGGGGGSSTSASSTATSTQNIDRRMVTDNGATAINASNSTLRINNTVTDLGAIKAAAGVAHDALTTASTDFKTLLDTTKVLNGGALDALNSNIKLTQSLATTAQSAYSDAASQAQGNKNMVYAGLAVVALAGLSFFSRKA